jgi:hypothetical protein
VGWLDAGARGKVGGWWVGVSVYCELEKYADILHSVRSISHQTWSGGIGWAVCGKPGCPSRVSCFCPRGITEQSLDHADSRPAFFSEAEHDTAPVEPHKMPKPCQRSIDIEGGWILP